MINLKLKAVVFMIILTVSCSPDIKIEHVEIETKIPQVIPARFKPFQKYNQVNQYDHYFKKYSKRYFGPGFNWYLFKAQSIAESNLKPHARSGAGAQGIMQIMPATYGEIKRKNDQIRGSIFDPKVAIPAGIYYDRQIWNVWQAERPRQDRINFTMGAYNCGTRHVINAQIQAKSQNLNPNLWKSIEEVLPNITGHRSAETIEYVKKIEGLQKILQ